MTVTVYRSTDISAPVLNGSAGSLVTVLDACLVLGYGSQLPAGWSVAATATNKRIYKQGIGSNQRFLKVDDSGADATAGQNARVSGCLRFTDINTLVEEFPGNPLGASGNSYLFWIKSNATPGTARPWIIIATSSFFWIYIQTIDGGGVTIQNQFFGDFTPTMANDKYNTIITGQFFTSTPDSVNLTLSTSYIVSSPVAFCLRNLLQMPGTASNGLISESYFLSGTNYGNGGLVYPNTPDDKLYVTNINVIESPKYARSTSSTNHGYIRGILPGMVVPCHNGNSFLSAGQTITGINNLPGKTFEARPVGQGALAKKWILFETSNTW